MIILFIQKSTSKCVCDIKLTEIFDTVFSDQVFEVQGNVCTWSTCQFRLAHLGCSIPGCSIPVCYGWEWFVPSRVQVLGPWSSLW